MNMLTLTIAATILSCSCSFAYAALPPLYETLKEFKSLINDPRLEENLTSADAIQKIERTDKGFVVTTNKRTMNVGIVYEPALRPGPAKYKLVFEKDNDNHTTE